VTAVTAERKQDAERAEALPGPARLTERQLLGIDCARCGEYLGIDARVLGEVMDHGYLLRLFGCDPRCTLPRRVRNAAWPPGKPPRPTRPPTPP
jgi:hypothetical protein